MANLAIIPARGGSKRIPRKNIRTFVDKPIIAFSIEAAIKSGIFDYVVVSTDDEEIAQIAQENGAKVPFFRSEKNSDDFATTFDVINEVVHELEKFGKTFDYAACIYPTAPLINFQRFTESFKLLKSQKFDCVFPVVPFSYPIQRAIKINNNQSMSLFDSKSLNKRSQDLETAYHDSGQFYFFDINKILQKGKLWTDNTGVIVLDEMEVQDIDNETDWKLAELKYEILQGSK